MEPSITIIKSEWHPEVAERAAVEAGEAASRAGAEAVFARAQQEVPQDQGTLAASGEVVGDGLEWFVSYGVPYAPILRAHPEWDYQGGRSGRWLDEAMEDESNVSSAMESAARSAWPGG